MTMSGQENMQNALRKKTLYNYSKCLKRWRCYALVMARYIS